MATPAPHSSHRPAKLKSCIRFAPASQGKHRRAFLAPNKIYRPKPLQPAHCKVLPRAQLRSVKIPKNPADPQRPPCRYPPKRCGARELSFVPPNLWKTERTPATTMPLSSKTLRRPRAQLRSAKLWKTMRTPSDHHAAILQSAAPPASSASLRQNSGKPYGPPSDHHAAILQNAAPLASSASFRQTLENHADPQDHDAAILQNAASPAPP